MKRILYCSLIIGLWPWTLIAAEPTPVPFELQPYRVRISLVCAESAELDLGFCRSLIKEIPEISDRLLGEMWAVSTEENHWLFPTSSEHLAQLPAAQLPTDWTAETFDKNFLLIVEEAGGKYLLCGREWDPTGGTLGPAISRVVQQRRELSTALFRLAHDLFRPRLQIERITDDVAAITVQAGALPPADPNFAQLRKDQYWQPFLRYHNPQGGIEKLQSVPWTLLKVTEINPDNPAHGQARVISGLRFPLPNRRRPRMDLFARALEPVAPATKLRLVSRRAPEKPLIGVIVDARSQPETPATRLMTDRNGVIRIPTQPKNPLLWLSVRSGEKTLAYLPLVPGLEAQLTAELPDDSIRLRVEGELSILQSNLTDTVAQRAVLMASIRRLIQLGDWKSANELRRELRLLPITDNYLKDLNAIRIPALKTAQAAKDKGAAAYIERVCGEASKLIQKYLDEEKMKVFEDEVKELERLTKDAAKSPVKPPAATP